MNREYSFQKAPRCSATSKRTRERCKAPAVRGCTVCRFHGARGGGPRGERNGMYRHGLYTKEAIEERWFFRELGRVLINAGTDRMSAFGATADMGRRIVPTISPLLTRSGPPPNYSMAVFQ